MNHEPPSPIPHDQFDDSPEAFAERVRTLYGIEMTSLDELVDLARTEPDGERFGVLLDDLTYESLDQNPEFDKNRRAMTSGKLSPAELIETRNKQRELFSQYRQAIIEEAGLPTEAGLTEIQKSQQKIQSIVNKTLSASDTVEPVRVLDSLGIITLDSEGREVFTYPVELFPRSVDGKWSTYLESVRNHLRVVKDVHNGTKDKSELGEADSTRRMAHNAVARDVHEILGLDKLAGSEWTFEKTRNLLAKMRDSRFPNVDTAERFVTEGAITEGLVGLHALKVLRTRISDLHK